MIILPQMKGKVLEIVKDSRTFIHDNKPEN